MADNYGSKRYVSRVDLIARSENPLEIKALLHCSGFMNQRYLAAVVWLVASGPSGLNAAEAASLSGLDSVAVDAALHTLRTRGLLQLAPVLPGDLGERFIFNFSRLRLELGEPESEAGPESESGKNPDESEKNSGIAFATRGAFTGNQEEDSYNTSPSEITNLRFVMERKRKRKILKSARNQIEKIGAWENGSLAASGGEPNGSPSDLQPRTSGQGPEQETGGTTPGGRSALADEFKRRKDRAVERGQETKKVARSYLETPSENPMVRGWEGKENPDRWKDLDWVGYWLQHYRAFYGAEDPRFVGYLPSPTKGKLRAALNKHDIYFETASKIEQFRDHDRCFRGDAAGLRTFFDWLFKEFLPGADWLKDPVNVIQITRLASNTWLEKFKARHIKVKGKESKGKGRWRPWGYETE